MVAEHAEVSLGFGTEWPLSSAGYSTQTGSLQQGEERHPPACLGWDFVLIWKFGCQVLQS